ncbi:MAG: hypothetical protein GX675_01965 [Erysipelotrichaceae bacterium]|nr:hypothetical protein [Erysipelotrichaceae bacterium]
MAQLKTALIVSIFIISMLFTSIVNAQKVEALETTPSKYDVNVVVPINHLDITNLVKEQVLTSISNQDHTYVLDNIDLEKTTITMEPIDFTKVNQVSTKILINIANKYDANTLTPSTVNVIANISVIDDVAPELVLTKEKVNVKLDSEFDPWQYVEYAYDNSQEYPTVAIINNVDTSTLGEYEVVFAASDASGNRYSTTLQVNVTKNAVSTGSVVYNGDDILYMLDLINAARADRGLSPLSLADEAGQSAVAIRASEAASYLSHTRPDGSHYKTALNEMGASYYRSPLEVLTYSGNSVEAKFNWWMGSTNHHAILMKDGYTTIAIAYSGKMWCAIVY